MPPDAAARAFPMTERLYYHDSFLRRFSAKMVGCTEDGGVLLDRSAFYPESGGQDCDTGWLGGVRVTRVEEREAAIVHHLENPRSLQLSPGSPIEGEIDWERRFDLMQQHSGQHLLSAVAQDLFGWETASVHLGAGSATVEFAVPQASPEELAQLEQRVNLEIAAARPVSAGMYAPDAAPPLRKPTARTGMLRIVTIEGIDHSACGGTHVGSTAQIGCLLLGATERIRKQVRLEFACGLRAMRRAAEMRLLLSRCAASLQCHPAQLPELVARQRDEALQAAKREKGLSRELATFQGREARSRLPHGGVGPAAQACVAVRWVPASPAEAERAFANAFCETPASILLTACAETGAFLLGCHPESGFDAAQWLRETAAASGAKGGGSATMVSGRVTPADQARMLPGLLPGRAVILDS